MARIIDKKKIYRVDVELDQIMTCFKISLANICSYFLEEFFNGEKMTLENLFECVFDLHCEYKIEDKQKNIRIERNNKQKDIMKKLEPAINDINGRKIKDLNGNIYNFR